MQGAEAGQRGVSTGISVVLITLNEEKNIEACLDTVRWADEVVVVDSFSKDGTVELARAKGARVIQRQWPGMVGTQRNAGLDAVAGPWVLFLDADERVTPALRDELLAAARAGGIVGGRLPRRNFLFGRWLRCTWPDLTSRFVRKGEGRYNEVDGRGFDAMVFGAGTVRDFESPLDHLTGETLAVRLRKLDFDTTLQAGEKFRAGRSATFANLVFSAPVAFARTYFLKRGFLDGWAGFIFSCLYSFNTFMKYAKLWEMRAR
ncbi:MAG TPA: glycosyltransferase family 2 protein [Anaeromyxobacteraceae bacterium]|nr:glycosyltransferase family 2 protein [Anaeromyxobacteraceae bacterium]